MLHDTSSLSADFDQCALTQGPRYPGHARRRGLAQIQRGAREEEGAGHRPLGAGGLGEGAEEGQRGQGRGAVPLPGVLHRAPCVRQAPLPHALGADRGVRALPLRVRGWAAGPGLLTIKGRVNGLRVDLGDSLVKSKGPVSIAVDASGIESRSTTEGTGSGGSGR